MNPELEKCRLHHHALPPHVKERATAKFLLIAIQIAERCEQDAEMLKTAILDNVRDSEAK